MWWIIGVAAWTLLGAAIVSWWSTRDARALLRLRTREYRDATRKP